jgi:hypothetical protein
MSNHIVVRLVSLQQSTNFHLKLQKETCKGSDKIS